MVNDNSSTTVGNSDKAKPTSAVQFVDAKIIEVTGRDSVPISEVTNMLLDIRLFLMGHSVKEKEIV